MADTNITLMLHKKDDLRLEERPILEPGFGEVQIQMQSVSICGSDVRLWTTGVMGIPLDEPTALGHEGSGVVVKLGEGVTSLKVGDRVAIEPATSCRLCRFCKNGRYNLCPNVKGLAMPGCHGHITRIFTHAADFCHKVPDSMTFEEAALMEPLAVCVHATTRGRMKMGNRVFISGSGPIGIICLLVAKARGAVSVIITDIDDQRLEFARKMGADHVINVKDMKPEDVAVKVTDQWDDKADVAMECSGSSQGVASAIFSTASGGVVVIVGMSTMWKEIPILDNTFREVDLVGSFRYKGSFPTAISMVESGQINVKALITHRFDILQSTDAFQLVKKGLAIKAVINCGRQGS